MRERPILLSAREIREIGGGRQTKLIRTLRLRPGKFFRCPWGQVGDVLCVRESFSTRLDGQRIKVRYPADQGNGEPSYIPADQVPSKYRTAKYLTRQAKYMPRWASRTLLRIERLELRPEGDTVECRMFVRLLRAPRPGDVARKVPWQLCHVLWQTGIF